MRTLPEDESGNSSTMLQTMRGRESSTETTLLQCGMPKSRLDQASRRSSRQEREIENWLDRRVWEGHRWKTHTFKNADIFSLASNFCMCLYFICNNRFFKLVTLSYHPRRIFCYNLFGTRLYVPFA